MGGGNKKRLQTAAETTAQTANTQEQQRASAMQTNLQQRADIVGAGIPQAQQQTLDTATNMAQTGGFTPEQQQQFLRQSTAPTTAIYGNIQDQMNRQKALQGGYSPGFSASTAKVARQGAQAGAEAGLAGSVALNQQINANKMAGADLLQRYTTQGEAALNENDISQLRNRLQSGQMSQEDAQLLTTLAAQNKTLFDNIMQGVSAIGGAAAGVITGVGKLGGSAPATT